MKEFTTVGDIATRIHELAEGKYKFTTVLRGVKESVMFLGFYSKSLMGIKSTIVKVEDNMTALLPSDCSGVTKVAKLYGRSLIELDRQSNILNKDLYIARQQQESCCDDDCSCGRGTALTLDTVPSAFNTQSTGVSVSHCTCSTFFNYGNNAYLHSYYIRNFGQFEEDIKNNRLVLSGIMIGDELLVEHKTMLNAETYQLVPQKAFDVIRFKCLTYIDPDNRSHVQQFKMYKRLFDISEVPSITIEQLTRKLRGY
jgi:hypothetical protein